MNAGTGPGGCVLLGIDPGTAVTGFGAVVVDARRHAELLECGVIRTSPRASLVVRLLEIHEGVEELIARLSPEVMAIESAFYGKNVRSAMTLGQARGAIIVAAARSGVEVAEYAPRAIKRAVTGTGSATKEQVAYMVRRHLRLRSDPKPADAADGIAAALCHAYTRPLPQGAASSRAAS